MYFDSPDKVESIDPAAVVGFAGKDRDFERIRMGPEREDFALAY
jgi:hypothetical protein